MATPAYATPAPDIITYSPAQPLASASLMLAVDFVSLCIAGFFGSQIWRVFFNISAPPVYVRFWPALFLFVIMFAADGLYPGVGIGPVETLRRLVRGSTAIYMMLTVTIFLTRGAAWESRGGFIVSWALSIVILPLARAAAHYWWADKPWFGVPAVILGAGNTAALLVEKLRLAPELGIKPVACLDDDPVKTGLLGGVPVLSPLALASSIARSARVRHALVAMPGLGNERLLPLLEKWSLVFPHVYLIPNLMGLASIPVSPVDVGGVLALELRHNLLFAVNRYLKRALDLLLVAVLLPFAIPVTILAALWIYLVSPHNPFFWHQREGEDGRTLWILKLRTMHPNADALLEDYLDQNPEAREEWERYCKLKDDPRILPGVGHFLRRSSLDELPQLWNILIGQMSLVGPRPFPRYHMNQFHSSFRDLRTRVRPGLTGLWQISARSDGDLETQTILDTYYIRNWSLWLDIFILSRTIRAVLLGRGAY